MSLVTHEGYKTLMETKTGNNDNKTYFEITTTYQEKRTIVVLSQKKKCFFLPSTQKRGTAITEPSGVADGIHQTEYL